MELLILILNFLQNIIWPLLIVLIFGYRGAHALLAAIVRVLDRVKSFKYRDTNFDTYVPMQENKKPETNFDFEKSLPSSDPAKSDNDKVAKDYFYKNDEEYQKHAYELSKEQEKHIRLIIKSNYQNKPSKALDNHLIETLAETIAIKNYLWIKCNIMPEQLELLRRLNITSLRDDQAKYYYNSTLIRFNISENGYPFNEFMGWLINQGLIIKKGALFDITILGNEFLFFLIKNRIP